MTAQLISNTTGILNLSDDGKISLSGTNASFTLPNYATGSLPSGNEGDVVFNTSTLKVMAYNGTIWQNVSNGASFGIGTVIQAPSAPTDGGTWFECNGQNLLQSTYSSLFGSIGHNYMTFSTTTGGFQYNLSTVFNIGNGTWLGLSSATLTSGTTYRTTDGTTWATAGNLTNFSNGVTYIVSNETGIVLTIYSNTGNISTNYGTSWSNIFLPASPSGPPIWNGSYFLFVDASSRNIYYSSNGSSWTTATNVLPIGSIGGSLIWDGTNWCVFDTSNPFNVYTTTVSNGTSGWSTVTNVTGLILNYPYSTNKSGTIVGIQNQGLSLSSSPAILQMTTNKFSTITSNLLPFNVGPPSLSINPSQIRSPGIFWTGFTFIYGGGGNSSSSLPGGSWLISANGTQWQSLSINGFPPSFNVGGVASDTYLGGVDLTGTIAMFNTANKANGKWILTVQSAGGLITYLCSPVCVPTTEFCVPTTQAISWIKAL